MPISLTSMPSPAHAPNSFPTRDASIPRPEPSVRPYSQKKDTARWWAGRRSVWRDGGRKAWWWWFARRAPSRLCDRLVDLIAPQAGHMESVRPVVAEPNASSRFRFGRPCPRHACRVLRASFEAGVSSCSPGASLLRRSRGRGSCTARSGRILSPRACGARLHHPSQHQSPSASCIGTW
jgi:hypothetical protein